MVIDNVDLINRNLVQNRIAELLSGYLHEDTRSILENLDEFVGELPRRDLSDMEFHVREFLKVHENADLMRIIAGVLKEKEKEGDTHEEG